MLKKKKMFYFTVLLITTVGLILFLDEKKENEIKIEQVKIENHEMKKKELERDSLDESNDRENGLKVYLIKEKGQKIVWLIVSSGTLNPPPENILIEEKDKKIVVKVKNSKTGSIFQEKKNYHYKISVDYEIKKIKVAAE